MVKELNTIKIEGALRKWLHDNEINCDIDFDDDFCYDAAANKVTIGKKYNSDVRVLFEQFLYEYGMEYVGFDFYTLGFLHEIGHIFSYSNFSFIELVYCSMDKLFIDGSDDAFCYWEIDDEFAANVWAINFINEHIEAVEKLINIFLKGMCDNGC